MQRRSFLQRTAFWLAAAAGWSACDKERPAALPARRPVSLAPVEDIRPGRNEFELYRVAVLSEPAPEGARRLAAVSIVCTHQTCLLRHSSGGGGYLCPCHGSRFDAQGRVLRGPAVRPLPWYKLSVERGRLQLHMNEIVDPEWRLIVSA